jgi:spoIIIJ-associated protein
MQSIETTGKSVEEATKTAASKLGVGEDQLNVTVIEETKGLFGKSTVRVRAEVKAAKAAPAPKAAKASNGKVEAKAEPAPAPAEKPAKKGRAKVEKKVEEEEPPAEAAPADEASEPDVVATQADADNFINLLEDLVSKAELDVQAKVTQVNGRYVNIELDGKDVAYLVGKHGEVLNALQYLVNIIAGRTFGNGVRATIDGNHYRNRREQQLTAHAKRVADEVKKRGEEAVLDALPAFERRIVHKALSEYEGVSTYSEGEEPNRRVVIAPAD